MKFKTGLTCLLAVFFSISVFASRDVLHYTAQIEPDIKSGAINGIVTIFFSADSSETKFEFACADLKIDSVFSDQKKITFEQSGKKVKGNLNQLFHTDNSVYRVRFYYHGNPSGGIKFFPEEEQVYTVYSTQTWMICNEDLLDKASMDMLLLVPKDMKSVASGDLVASVSLVNGKKLENWKQETAVPAYTYGFSIGRFNEFSQTHNTISLNAFAAEHTPVQLDSIFKETGAMLDFFELHSGVPYPGKSYTQVIAKGNVSQEMSGFCVLWDGYGKQVLGDSIQINLSAHELAHQWWGNHITCKDWRHFWLNEGLAVFMSSAYKEHRFGRAEYMKDIEFYCQKFQSVPNKPLVFPNWDNPVREDRIIVYFKGAYVFHLLKEMLGDEIFWKGIRNYSQANFEGTVVSSDLQAAMEKASGKDLGAFFKEWVY